MTQKKRSSKVEPKKIAESTSKKVLAFLNAAQSAEEIASVIEIEGERDVGVKIAQSLLDRRARLGGFQNLDQVAATPQVGEVRFSQIVKALEARKETATTYVIEGQVRTSKKTDFASDKLAVHAVIKGVEVARAEVDAKGRYEVTFEYNDQPPNTELRILPAKIPLRKSKGFAISKTVSFARYRRDETIYRAAMDIRVAEEYFATWRRVTEEYRMHGVVWATTFRDDGSVLSVEPLPAAKIEFYEVDFNPFGFSSVPTESYLGYAYTAPDGSYDFTFNFSYQTGIVYIYADQVPDIRARISQFVDGLWTQVYEGPVDWNVVQDFHCDYFVPIEDVIPVPDSPIKPEEGFRFVSLGLLPIDDDHIQLGYAFSQEDDPIDVSHQPFCDTLRIFGLWAAVPPVSTYKIQIAATEDGDTVPEDEDPAWQDVTDPLRNSKWNETMRSWDVKVLGPNPDTGRYQNIDIEPEADWHEHALKVTWNSRNVADGYYALRIIGYDASDVEVATFRMPIIRVDNSLPDEIELEVVGTPLEPVTDCGGIQLPDDPENRKIMFMVTALDAEGHVKRYMLSWSRGKDGVSVFGTWKTRPTSPVAGWVGWDDEPEEISPSALPSELSDCPAVAYNVELHVRGLSTDGYSAEPTSQWAKRECNLVVYEPTED